ncbi:MAG TPA: sulfite exporter TauE/SafE family protein [Solirubrobacterales bacterium]|nr:sulfite exporter TauE/SafE family protein [Solirubrobacterales bacterium]
MDALELIAVLVWSFTVSFFGGLVGLVLGNLRLPLIVLVASSPAAGAGANVAISGAAAITAGYGHWRGGRISWRLFWWMAPTSLVGAIIGGLIAGVLPDRILLAAISVVVLYGAVEVWRYQRPKPDQPDRVPSHRELLINAALVGFGVGVLGGLVGLILGSLRLPAMVRWAGVSPYAAVGTNAAVGAVVGVGGLIGHLPSGVDWGILAVGAAAAMPAAYLGSRFTGRLDERQLIRAMAAVLVVSGCAMAVQAILG